MQTSTGTDKAPVFGHTKNCAPPASKPPRQPQCTLLFWYVPSSYLLYCLALQPFDENLSRTKCDGIYLGNRLSNYATRRLALRVISTLPARIQTLRKQTFVFTTLVFSRTLAASQTQTLVSPKLGARKLVEILRLALSGSSIHPLAI
jgi:hypothetical protein